jgi:hypothetical protein
MQEGYVVYKIFRVAVIGQPSSDRRYCVLGLIMSDLIMMKVYKTNTLIIRTSAPDRSDQRWYPAFRIFMSFVDNVSGDTAHDILSLNFDLGAI